MTIYNIVILYKLKVDYNQNHDEVNELHFTEIIFLRTMHIAQQTLSPLAEAVNFGVDGTNLHCTRFVSKCVTNPEFTGPYYLVFQ